jgi:hypothetical protein
MKRRHSWFVAERVLCAFVVAVTSVLLLAADRRLTAWMP